MKRRKTGPRLSNGKRRRGTAQRATSIDWGADTNISSDEDEEPKVGAKGRKAREDEAEDAAAAEAAAEAAAKRETAQEKRIRLAKQYLEALEQETRGDEDEDGDGYESEGDGIRQDDEDRVGAVLTQDAMRERGRLFRPAAASVADAGAEALAAGVKQSSRAHKLSITCVAVTDDDATAYSGSKDCCIVRWDAETGKRVAKYGGKRRKKGEVDVKTARMHTDQILAVAVSSDGRLVASGGRDRMVRVWDTRSNDYRETFAGHMDAVTGLAFQRNTRLLFSGSHDRTIKIWNMADMAYVDTLFGHQSEINAVAAHRKERAVSVGRDASARVWKIVDESQLVFRGAGGSVDCVAMVNDGTFATGGENGRLALWTDTKKKAVCSVEDAHGEGHWISAVAALDDSDLLATGSNDGFLRLWRHDAKGRDLDEVAAVPMRGFVNGLAFARSGRFLVAGVGQEHRLGRWWRDGKARNDVRFVSLPVRLR